MKKVNFIVKTKDAKAGEITKALKAAKIDVESVTMLYSEETTVEISEDSKD
jgi:hypothetical protein